MATISFAFIPGDIVYVKKHRLNEVCAPHAYIQMTIETFFRFHNCNYYRLNDNKFYREDFLLSLTDYQSSLAADDAQSIKCLNRLLENL
jgi:hypothetical protein